LLAVYGAIADKAGKEPAQATNPETNEPSVLPDRSGFGPGNCDHHQQLAQLRGFHVATVTWAVERGVLVFGCWSGHQCYGVCDRSGRLVEIRRLDGINFPAVGEESRVKA